MKRVDLLNEILPFEVAEGIEDAIAHLRRRPLPLQLFLLLCLNLVIAPAVYAATNAEISKTQAWAIGLLGLVTLGLTIYLFVVVFQPERF